MDLADHSNETSQITPPLFPESRVWRLLYGIVITILPVFCFAYVNVLKPNWQSGEISDYTSLILFPEASYPFFPLLAYSSVSLIFLLVATRRYAKFFWIRFGIYTGFLLALQYAILMLLALRLVVPEIDLVTKDLYVGK